MALRQPTSLQRTMGQPAGSSAGSRSSRGRSSGEAPTPELPAEAARCAELLAALPAELLARAAFRAGAHARALRGFEAHARAKSGGGLNPAAARSAVYDHADVSFLQVPACAESCMSGTQRPSPTGRTQPRATCCAARRDLVTAHV